METHCQDCDIIRVAGVLEPAEGADVVPASHGGSEGAAGEWGGACGAGSLQVHVQVGGEAAQGLEYT